MKSAFVTGARQGLGKGFADHLLDEGFMVFAGVHTKTDDMVDTEKLHWIEIDVTDDHSIERASQQAANMTQQIDLLINSAGVNKDTATNNHKEIVSNLSELDRQTVLSMFDINSVSPMMVTQKFLKLLTGKPSFVINVSSCRASFHDKEGNDSGNYGYRASKVALNMFTLCSLHDLPSNVKTFTVHPGNVRSKMNPTANMDPKEQARKIVAITENWNNEHNGLFFNYDGTLYPL